MELKPGYKQTEVGVIPEEWDCVHIGDVAETSSGATPPRAKQQEYFDGGAIPWVKTLDLNNSSILETDECVTSSALQQTSLRVYPSGSVLVAMYGGFNQIGRTGMLTKDATINQALTAIRPDRSRLSSRFLLNYLNYRVEYWKSVASSSRKDPNITGRDVREFPIPLPPLKEQEAVGEALQDAEDQISILEELIAKKRDIKQAAMQELLTGKRRLPGFEGEWEVKRLGEIADIDPESLAAGTLPDFHFNYISLEDVDHGNLRSYSGQVFESAPSRARRRLRQNDILFSTVRPNLLSHLLFGECGDRWVASTGFSVARCRPGMAHPGYVFAHLFADGMNRQIEAVLTGSNYPAINSRDVRALEIPLPPYPEQYAIAAVLTDIDAELSALEARHNKTCALKQAMMQELLTGRIRLR
jgi:type I restriction enzyme S subunit